MNEAFEVRLVFECVSDGALRERFTSTTSSVIDNDSEDLCVPHIQSLLVVHDKMVTVQGRILTDVKAGDSFLESVNHIVFFRFNMLILHIIQHVFPVIVIRETLSR